MSASPTDVAAEIECTLCVRDLPQSTCGLACGQPGCDERACNDCLHTWYLANAPGRVLVPGSLLCPYCRRVPSAATIARLDLPTPPLDANIAVADAAEWAHAWCVGCWTARRYAERSCAEAAASTMANLANWHCSECQDLVIKTCPGCGIRVEKTSGCDHMECYVCHADWCFYCGQPFPSSTEVYDHLDNVHGGQDNVPVADDDFDMARFLRLFPH